MLEWECNVHAGNRVRDVHIHIKDYPGRGQDLSIRMPTYTIVGVCMGLPMRGVFELQHSPADMQQRRGSCMSVQSTGAWPCPLGSLTQGCSSVLVGSHIMQYELNHLLVEASQH